MFIFIPLYKCIHTYIHVCVDGDKQDCQILHTHVIVFRATQISVFCNIQQAAGMLALPFVLR